MQNVFPLYELDNKVILLSLMVSLPVACIRCSSLVEPRREVTQWGEQPRTPWEEPRHSLGQTTTDGSTGHAFINIS